MNSSFERKPIMENTREEKDEVDGGKIMFMAQTSRRLQLFRHYYQHPYFRIFIAYFVILCNFFIYAEDPVAHSLSKCEIPLVGNAFSFVATKYPSSGFSALKILLWLIAIITGIIVGKVVFHHFLFKRLFKLSMFANDQGSWLVCFLVTIISLLCFSFLYNAFLSLDESMASYQITGYIGAKNTTFMRAAALGTWGGDFLTAWMVTDMMLQDFKKYPKWAVGARRWWNQGLRRVILFWTTSVTCTILVVVTICTDRINWDKLNGDIFYTNEVGRAYLASFILVMDFTIVMQDWDFPLFQSNMDVKLPGLNTANIRFKIPQCLRRQQWTVHVTGKWFNYGILFFVMILDLNMWKNQIFYKPLDFAQYTGLDSRIYSVRDEFSLDHYKNATVYSYEWRLKHIDPITNRTFLSADVISNSRYRHYSLVTRGFAFIPSLLAMIMFGLLIYIFGREGSKQFEAVEFRKATRISSVKIRSKNKDEMDSAKVAFSDDDEDETAKKESKSPSITEYGSTNTGNNTVIS